MRARRLLAVLALGFSAALGFGLVLSIPAPAVAAPLSNVVHAETVPLGNSTMTVSFTDWPIRAHRSLDIIFTPAGGIQGRSARLRAVSPSGKGVALGLPALLQSFGITRTDAEIDLPHYPRAPENWGVDLVTLTDPGVWHFEVTVTQPGGPVRTSIPVPVGPRPGPSATLAWVVGILPWIVPVPYLILGWVRSRPIRLRDARAWTW